MAVAVFSHEVGTLGSLATGGAAKHEHNLGVSWQSNSFCLICERYKQHSFILFYL